MSCKGLKGKALADCKKNNPTWKNFRMANAARNRSEGADTNRPAKKRDSAQYKRGYQMGLKRLKPTAKTNPYGETEFEKMGRWEGQNTKKKKSY